MKMNYTVHEEIKYINVTPIFKADRRENQPASEKQAVSDATALYEVCLTCLLKRCCRYIFEIYCLA
jgi:hypothetical protein